MLDKYFCIKDISTYRSQLMGWAIIWIMMLHFSFKQISPLGFVAQYGYAGVEMFMFVSGFGLSFSLDKDSRLKTFYKRRFIRIFPVYYLLGIISSVYLFHDSFLTYLFRYTTIGFWTGQPYWEWYVPSIVILYLIAPFVKKMVDKHNCYITVFVAFVILCLSFFIIANEIVKEKDEHLFCLYRIPAFIFGMQCAFWMKNGISGKHYYILLLIGFPFFALLFPCHHEIYNYKYFSLIFLLPFFILCFVLISKYIKLFSPIVSEIGKASLEVYLIQTLFFHAILIGYIVIDPKWHDAATILLIIISSLLGIVVHRLIDKSGILQRL